MLHIAHDFTQKTLGVHRAGKHAYRTSWCWCASLQNLVFHTMQLQSYLDTHRCANRSMRVCKDECLHMWSELNAALWFVLTRVCCGKLHSLHSPVQKCSSTQTQWMVLTAVRGRRAVWWPWIFLCGFCESAPTKGGNKNYNSWMMSILFEDKEKSRILSEKCMLQEKKGGKKEKTSHSHNLSNSPCTFFSSSQSSCTSCFMFSYFLLCNFLLQFPHLRPFSFFPMVES